MKYIAIFPIDWYWPHPPAIALHRVTSKNADYIFEDLSTPN